MKVGTILVLIGTILFAIAMVETQTSEPRGRFFASGTLLGLAGVLVGVGVLLGAPALN